MLHRLLGATHPRRQTEIVSGIHLVQSRVFRIAQWGGGSLVDEVIPLVGYRGKVAR